MELRPESVTTISGRLSPSTSPIDRSRALEKGPGSEVTTKESLRMISGIIRTLSMVAVERSPPGLPIRSKISVASVPGVRLEISSVMVDPLRVTREPAE